MSAAFERLSPALKYHIVNTLQWPALRPVQELTTDAVLDEKNCVVLAPTAGGKTEASFFPVLSRMDTEDWKPVSVLYLSPIRALLNNQEARVSGYAQMLGRRVFKWHGDVATGPRKRFLEDPTDIVLITPESLEAQLMSSRVSAERLYQNLRAVIIDEIHAFAADDRGAHLAAVLERLCRVTSHDVQRIGLSATVGNPEAISEWMQGSSRREACVIDPGGGKAEPELLIDYVATVPNAATVIARAHPGKKRLVFTDSRRVAEDLGQQLTTRKVAAYLIHGSLSVARRREAERAFEQGEDCVIVATSALELGIDIGDLDHVLQIDAPNTVASFLQRMGRTGRRAGTIPNCTFLAVDEKKVLHAAAMLVLRSEGYVEPIEPSRAAKHIYAHQAMALAIQTGGLPRPAIDTWLEGVSSFSGLGERERSAILDHMLKEDILADHDGRIWLGREGEKKFGGGNFRRLYAVFEAPREFDVRHHLEQIGTVDYDFLELLLEKDQPPTFVLGGRPWRVHDIDYKRATCEVRPAEDARAPRWAGGPRPLGRELCKAIRRVLVEPDLGLPLTERASKVLDALRKEHEFLVDAPEPCLITDKNGDLVWWNFEGGVRNLLYARILEHELGGQVTGRDLSVTLKQEAAKSLVAAREAIEGLVREGRPNAADRERFGEDPSTRRRRYGKFAGCVP